MFQMCPHRLSWSGLIPRTSKPLGMKYLPVVEEMTFMAPFDGEAVLYLRSSLLDES